MSLGIAVIDTERQWGKVRHSVLIILERPRAAPFGGSARCSLLILGVGVSAVARVHQLVHGVTENDQQARSQPSAWAQSTRDRCREGSPVGYRCREDRRQDAPSPRF